MLVRVDAILWRRCNTATIDTLLGLSRGQYHITLQTHSYDEFFVGLAKHNPTDLGGHEYHVPIASFTGTSPVPERTLVVRYMGPRSARQDWNISAQRPDTAYELWRPDRGFIDRASAGDRDFLVIIRDGTQNFHARWIRSVDFPVLPPVIQEHMLRTAAGWVKL